MSEANPRKILLLAANPHLTSPIRLSDEMRQIADALHSARRRSHFTLELKWIERTSDIRHAVLDLNPEIVHFSGHGSRTTGLEFENESGSVQIVSASALAGLFALASDQIDCVILNACYSAPQAEAISQHIPYVIGTSQEISDAAAIEFAVGFYHAIFAGHSVESAYEFGCSAIRLLGNAESFIPVLKKNVSLISERQSSLNQEKTTKLLTKQPNDKSSKVTWTIVLNASLDDLEENQAEAIVEYLRRISGDPSLELKKIESGSIILKLDGSMDGFKIMNLFIRKGNSRSY